MLYHPFCRSFASSRCHVIHVGNSLSSILVHHQSAGKNHKSLSAGSSLEAVGITGEGHDVLLDTVPDETVNTVEIVDLSNPTSLNSRDYIIFVLR